jgi:hydrogenase-4 component F
MLSGVLLPDALYVILRFAGITNAAGGTTMTHRLFAIVGLLSLGLGAFFLLRQRDIKRMLAYSSIEHMGVIAVGLAFGAPLAIAGALLHAVNHAASKSLAFFGAGRLAERYSTREMILTGGFAGGSGWLAAAATVLLVVAFAGLVRWVTATTTGEPPHGTERGEHAILPVAAMLLGFAVVLGLGVVVPNPLASLLVRASALFEGTP